MIISANQIQNLGHQIPPDPSTCYAPIVTVFRNKLGDNVLETGGIWAASVLCSWLHGAWLVFFSGEGSSKGNTMDKGSRSKTRF